MYQGTAFVKWVPLVFSRLGSQRLEEIHLGFLLDDPKNLEIVDWDTLEAEFSQPRFSKLRKLCVWLGGVAPGTPVITEASHWVKEKLSGCKSRGILTITSGAGVVV